MPNCGKIVTVNFVVRKFMNIIAFVKMKIYLCRTLKAIHNKDYSVVKTFKAGLTESRFFLIYLQKFK